MPSAFTEFPTQIWSIDDSTDDVVRTQITKYQAEEISGTRYFYADITEDEDILLIGKTQLTQFTTDTSTTELTDAQADCVALLAVSIFYRTQSGVVNASDSGRFDSLANRYLNRWDELKISMGMPMIFPEKDNMEWANV